MIDPFSQVVLPILIPDIPPSPSVNPTVEIHFSSQPSHANENPYQQISRIIKPPPYLKGFHYNLLYHQPTSSAPSSKHSYPLCNYISYNSLYLPYKTIISQYLQILNHDFIIKLFLINSEGMPCTLKLTAMEFNNT